MNHQSYRGAVPIAAILIIFALAAVVGGGYAYFKNIRNKNNSLSIRQSSSQNDQTTPSSVIATSSNNVIPSQQNPTSTFKTYTSVGLGVSFRYPSDWVVMEPEPHGLTIGTKTSLVLYSIGGGLPVFNCTTSECVKDLDEAVKQVGMTQVTPTTVGGYRAFQGLLPFLTSQDSNKPVVAYFVQVDNIGYMLWHHDTSDPTLSAGINEISSSITFLKSKTSTIPNNASSTTPSGCKYSDSQGNFSFNYPCDWQQSFLNGNPSFTGGSYATAYNLDIGSGRIGTQKALLKSKQLLYVESSIVVGGNQATSIVYDDPSVYGHGFIVGILNKGASGADFMLIAECNVQHDPDKVPPCNTGLDNAMENIILPSFIFNH